MKRILVKLLAVLVAGLALSPQVSTSLAQGEHFTLLTITNPTPATDDIFGYSLAAVGSDRVLIGAYLDDTGAFDAGVAYLFSTNGALLTTFTNPTPFFCCNNFGHSVATVGDDCMLIGADGASRAGVVYLFSTNGNLLNTITNPTPAPYEGFGYALAAMGGDRVLIGARYNSMGGSEAGAAFLFNTNGNLLTTFTNPTPASSEWFGRSVAAVGSDRVLIGADGNSAGAIAAGAAYLFSTNGELLTTFTNPSPAASDLFGRSVAAIGADRVVIGAERDDTGAKDAGAAYLFSTNGELLNSFTNPTPAADDRFGGCVAGAGGGRVLIGAPNDSTGATYSGVVYLFSTNGTLLNTVTNPTPVANDYFGRSVAVVGNAIVIGAIGDDTGATNAGAAYLFIAVDEMSGRPSLTIRFTVPNTVTISWPSPSTGWVLQESIDDLYSVNWSNAPGLIQDDGITKTLIVSPPSGDRFYRLSKPQAR
jgi:hypothetical protein